MRGLGWTPNPDQESELLWLQETSTDPSERPRNEKKKKKSSYAGMVTAQHRVGNSDASLLARLDLLFRRWASAQTQPAVACCALSSPHPQPDRMDLVKSLKVNAAKEHSA